MGDTNWHTDRTPKADTPPSIEDRARMACGCFHCLMDLHPDKRTAPEASCEVAERIAAELRAYGEQRAGEERDGIVRFMERGGWTTCDELIAAIRRRT